MNKRVISKVLLLLWVGLAILVFLCLRPPCLGRVCFRPVQWEPAGHRWLWKMHAGWDKALLREHRRYENSRESSLALSVAALGAFRIHKARLFLECLIALLLDAGAIATVILLSKRRVGENGKERG